MAFFNEYVAPKTLVKPRQIVTRLTIEQAAPLFHMGRNRFLLALRELGWLSVNREPSPEALFFYQYMEYGSEYHINKFGFVDLKPIVYITPSGCRELIRLLKS